MSPEKRKNTNQLEIPKPRKTPKSSEKHKGPHDKPKSEEWIKIKRSTSVPTHSNIGNENQNASRTSKTEEKPEMRRDVRRTLDFDDTLEVHKVLKRYEEQKRLRDGQKLKNRKSMNLIASEPTHLRIATKTENANASKSESDIKYISKRKKMAVKVRRRLDFSDIELTDSKIDNISQQSKQQKHKPVIEYDQQLSDMFKEFAEMSERMSGMQITTGKTGDNNESRRRHDSVPVKSGTTYSATIETPTTSPFTSTSTLHGMASASPLRSSLDLITFPIYTDTQSSEAPVNDIQIEIISETDVQQSSHSCPLVLRDNDSDQRMLDLEEHQTDFDDL